jgi:hypothetical protein
VGMALISFVTVWRYFSILLFPFAKRLFAPRQT